jgi:hypothetical protein
LFSIDFILYIAAHAHELNNSISFIFFVVCLGNQWAHELIDHEVDESSRAQYNVTNSNISNNMYAFKSHIHSHPINTTLHTQDEYNELRIVYLTLLAKFHSICTKYDATKILLDTHKNMTELFNAVKLAEDVFKTPQQ